MNKAILMGRLVRDPELRTTQTNISVCTFTLAVDRRFKNPNGERQADFINIVAWRQQAEFASQYFRQGSKMLVVGSIQNRSWDDKEGNKRYATEVIADEIYFADSKKVDGVGSRMYANDGGMDSDNGVMPGMDNTSSSFKAPSFKEVKDDFFTDDDDMGLPFEI